MKGIQHIRLACVKMLTVPLRFKLSGRRWGLTAATSPRSWSSHRVQRKNLECFSKPPDNLQDMLSVTVMLNTVQGLHANPNNLRLGV